MRRWLALVMLVAFSTGFGVIVGTGLDRSDSADASTQLTNMPEFQVLEETYDAIREHSVLSDKVTDQELIYGASSGMVDALGDEGHSRFLDPQAAIEFQRELSSELIGIGIHVDLTGPMPVVTAPLDGSPAFQAGIKPGDVIISVDGVESAHNDPETVTDLISGEEGTDVTLVLRHKNATETYEVTITREKITLNPVYRRMLPDGVLWLRLSEFSEGSAQAVQEALAWGKEQGMTGVILDLRNNPGGYTDEALGVGAQFMPSGSVLYQEQLADGTVNKKATTGDDGEWVEGKLVVLINLGSASAAEIVASSLQANGRAELYGETTFGTGTVLSGYRLSDGSIALLGTKLWLTADGKDIWKQGVDPSVEVSLSEDTYPAVPYEFQEDTISAQQFDGIADEQLHTAFASLFPATATPAATPAA
jgi:carboxyl-terminal processing protease